MSRLSRLPPLLALAVMLSLTACPPPIDTGDGGTDILVGPAGGIFLRNGYGIDVPAGAFTEEQRIFVTIIDEDIPEVPMRKRISRGYRFTPSTVVPKAPLTLYLPWVEDRLVAGVDPGTWDMRRGTMTEAYTALPGAKTNMMPFKAVEAKTDKLGLFWVTSPSQPNIARLELDPEEITLQVGESHQFNARVVSPTGETVEGARVTWRVVPARVALTDASGLVTALDPGIATLTATSGMQTVSAKINVRGTTVGPSTYAHQNPFPTGNDLYGGAIAPGGFGTVYAGTNGTVLVEDLMGGWTRVFSTPALTLKAVAGTSLTDAVAVGQANGAGVLLEFKGASMPPAVRVFQPTQISDLSQLWFDGTHGMGVGTGNEVVIRRNGMWTTEYHPSFEALLSVIGDGAGGFTVVGDLGSIYRWDPARNVWDSLYDMRLAVKLEAAQLVNFNGEAWAVGGNRLWHFTGAGWVAEALPSTPSISRATALGVFDSRVIVAGEARLAGASPLPTAKGVILVRAAAASWSSFPMRGQQLGRGVFGGGPTSPEGRVVGDFGAVWVWNTATADFTERSKGFQGDVADLAVTDTDVFAAVNECSDVRCVTRRGTVMHRGAAGFEPLGSLPTTEPVKAIVARSDTEVIVAAATSVFVWNGASWATVPADLAGPILDLQWCGNSLWGAGEGGTVYSGNATLLSGAGAIGQGRPLTSIHCPTDSQIWVAGDQFLSSRKTGGTWTQRTSDAVTQASWMAVWSPGVDEAFAFGDAQFGVYFDTNDLLAQESMPLAIDVATAMWGNKIDNLYMTGVTSAPTVSGFMLRFDGINWTPVDPGASRKGTALFGRSNNEIWLGTEGGGVLKAVPPP